MNFKIIPRSVDLSLGIGELVLDISFPEIIILFIITILKEEKLRARKSRREAHLICKVNDKVLAVKKWANQSFNANYTF